MEMRHPVIGDVRGGHGLYAVVELVRDQTSREPLAPWDEMLALSSSCCAQVCRLACRLRRGNLIRSAPPLVIEERTFPTRSVSSIGSSGELEAALQADSGDTVIQPRLEAKQTGQPAS